MQILSIITHHFAILLANKTHIYVPVNYFSNTMTKYKFYFAVAIISSMVLALNASNIGGDRQDINLSNDGGYTDLLVAISVRVTENTEIINRIKVGFHLVNIVTTTVAF